MIKESFKTVNLVTIQVYFHTSGYDVEDIKKNIITNKKIIGCYGSGNQNQRGTNLFEFA